MASLVSRRTPLGDLSNSMKAVASLIPHDASKMKSISKAPGKWQTAGRKPLSDISNSRKPETKKQSFNAKKLPVLTEESDQTSAIAGERSERHQVDERVRKIIELKDKVCSGTDNNFVVINQKGIGPPSLDLLARAGLPSKRV
ncbi:hypothetical protein OIU76_029748 [Salix suchowensis]|nr:hypothetical protein OIU76_029748 [Salix suchowensis]